MNCLMAENQRQAILESIPSPGAMLEWGPGGTTRWLLSRLKPNQRIISIEHSENWEGPIRDACGRYENWRMVFAPGPAGKNATAAEESPVGMEQYICPPSLGVEIRTFNVFLIDGVARGACLANVLLNARPGARVWLHDSNRNWYEWAKLAGSLRIAREQVIEPAPGEYPPLLWGCTL